MKIVFLAAGNSIHTIRWIQSLAKRGNQVYLLYNKGQAPIKDNHTPSDLTLVELPYCGLKGYYLNFYRARKLIDKIKPDIINAHYASGYGTLARLINRHPVVLSVWGSDVYKFPMKSIFNRTIFKKNIQFSDQIASTSECMARKVEILCKDAGKIEITPFGVDTNLFKPYQIIKNSEKVVIGVVKTLSENYGIEYIIKAFALLHYKILKQKRKERVELIICGKGEQRDYLVHLCQKLGIENQVKFLGYVMNKELPKVLNKMDIFVLGTVGSESFGVSAVEAMACGLPVIATDMEGFKEVVVHNETGFIVPAKNIEMMVCKMETLVKNPDLRKEFGEAGRKRCLKMYHWESNVNKMEDIYKVLAEKQKRGK